MPVNKNIAEAAMSEWHVPEAEGGSSDKEEHSARGFEDPCDERDSRPVDGEYHYKMPEIDLYQDAGFMPSDSTEVPRYYVPAEKKAKKSKKEKTRSGGFFKTLVLCLVCAILGGAGGGYLAVNYFAPDAQSEVSPIETQKPIIPSGNNANGVSGGSGNSIYSLGCTQAVGITTEVTTTNWFGQTSSSAVSGSGFVVTEDGYILTNYHVVEYAQKYRYNVTVMFYDGSSYDATIVGFEADNDIAVLKVDATGLTPVTVGDSDSVLVGDEVYAIGNPLGELAFSMTTGHVSALDRSIATSSNSPAINMFQFDAPVNSGNSGGPLYNGNGEVVGVVTAKYSSSGVEGLSFAIPINDAVDIANDLITNGYVTGRAYLGAYIDNRYSSVYADFYGMPEGAYVFNVESGSCAEKAGLCSGDIITKVDDLNITSYSELTAAVRRYKAGDTAVLTVYRSNKYITVNVTFDESKPSTNTQSADKSGLSGGQSFSA